MRFFAIDVISPWTKVLWYWNFNFYLIHTILWILFDEKVMDLNHKHFYRKLKPKLPLKGCLTSNIKYVQYFGYTHHISSILNVTVKMWRAHANTKGHANKQDILPGSKIRTLMFRFIVGLRTSRWERKISKKKVWMRIEKFDPRWLFL